MPEPRVTNFRPRWVQDLPDADRFLLSQTPPLGSMQPVAPRIDTRIVPSSGATGISAKSLAEAAAATQAIANYAGNDVSHGINPDFADLRSLSPEVQRLTRLTIEPFESGSFVIPAVFETPKVEITTEAGSRSITSQEVAHRFHDIIKIFAAPEVQPVVSIGAIQAVESLGAVLRREAAAIQFLGHDHLGNAFTPLLIDAEYMSRVGQVRERRQATLDKLDELQGMVTALDIRKHTLQLNVANQRSRVRGTFPPLYLPSFLESLGHSVRLRGYVTWKDEAPVAIQIFSVERLGEER